MVLCRICKSKSNQINLKKHSHVDFADGHVHPKCAIKLIASRTSAGKENFGKIFGRDYMLIVKDMLKYRKAPLAAKTIKEMIEDKWAHKYSPDTLCAFYKFIFWRENPDKYERKFGGDFPLMESIVISLYKKGRSVEKIQSDIIDAFGKAYPHNLLKEFVVKMYEEAPQYEWTPEMEIDKEGILSPRTDADKMATIVMSDNPFRFEFDKSTDRKPMMNSIIAKLTDNVPIFGNVTLLPRTVAINKAKGIPKHAFVYSEQIKKVIEPDEHSLFFFVEEDSEMQENVMEEISRIWVKYGSDYVSETLERAYPKKAHITSTTELRLEYKDKKWEDLPTDIQTHFILWAGEKGYRTKKIGGVKMRKNVRKIPPAKFKYYTTKKGKYIRRDVQPVGKFDERSFRMKLITSTVTGDVIKRYIVGCLKGKWDPRKNRCKVGVQVQGELYKDTPENRIKCRMKMTPEFKALYKKYLKKYSIGYALKKAWREFRDIYSVPQLMENIKYRRYLKPLTVIELARFKKDMHEGEYQENILPLIPLIAMSVAPLLIPKEKEKKARENVVGAVAAAARLAPRMIKLAAKMAPKIAKAGKAIEKAIPKEAQEKVLQKAVVETPGLVKEGQKGFGMSRENTISLLTELLENCVAPLKVQEKYVIIRGIKLPRATQRQIDKKRAVLDEAGFEEVGYKEYYPAGGTIGPFYRVEPGEQSNLLDNDSYTCYDDITDLGDELRSLLHLAWKEKGIPHDLVWISKPYTPMRENASRILTIKEIGEGEGLTGKVLGAFVKYMNKIFPDGHVNYWKEWAKRFAKKAEWYKSGLGGQRALKKIAPDLYKGLKVGEFGTRKNPKKEIWDIKITDKDGLAHWHLLVHKKRKGDREPEGRPGYALYWDYDAPILKMPVKMSPTFSTMKELNAWWMKKRRGIIEKEYYEWTGEKLSRKNPIKEIWVRADVIKKKHSKGWRVLVNRRGDISFKDFQRKKDAEDYAEKVVGEVNPIIRPRMAREIWTRMGDKARYDILRALPGVKYSHKRLSEISKWPWGRLPVEIQSGLRYKIPTNPASEGKKYGRAITLKQAKKLEYGDRIYHRRLRNADGTPQVFKVTGKPKIWKRAPERVRVPIKRGLWEHGYLDEDNLQDFTLQEKIKK